MKKKNYLFKGVTNDILKIWEDKCPEEIRKYIDCIETVSAKVKLTSLEAFIARQKIDKINKKCNIDLRLLKMKD